MAKITVKQYGEIADLMQRASVAQVERKLSLSMYRFMRYSERGLYATQDQFDTRKSIQEHIDVLGQVLETFITETTA